MVVAQNGGFFRHKVSAEITDTLVAVKKEELRIRKARVITKPGNKKAKSEVSAPTELEPSPTQDKPVRKTSSDDADGAEEQTQDKTVRKTSSDDADGAEEQTQDKTVRKTSSGDADGAEEQTQDKTVRKTSSDDADGTEVQTQDKTVRKTSSDDAGGTEEQTQPEVLTLELEDIRRVGLVKAGKKRFSELSRGKKVPEFVKRSHSEGYLPEAQARAGDSAATQLVPDWNTEKEEEDDITETVDKLLVTTGEEQGKDYEDILATILDNPDINQKEKERMFEDALIRKIVTHPEELNDAQRARMEESMRSVGKKVKEGMAKFALKTIDQCRLM
nr:hypothetical protein BaRGS_004138 [Batillaria attramentaria]